MKHEQNSLHTIDSLGEFGLIKHLTEKIKLINPSSLKGVGDDAAVIANRKSTTVVSTDMLLEGIHFDLMYMPLKHLGYKAVVVNLSDIFAMNAVPRQITVAMAISSKFTLEAVEELYAGIELACKKYGIDLIGGDTASSRQGLVLSLTAIGEADEKELVYRHTAKEGDLLCVSGDLGAAYVGYQLLEREKRVFLENQTAQPDLGGNEYILERQLKPEARADIYQLLQTIEVKPTAMIDISDGLASEMLHLCNQSGVGMKLYEEKIPVAQNTFDMARVFNLDPTMCALNGGEDYELLFTVSQNDYDKIKNVSEVSIIGHATEKSAGVQLITKAGNVHDITAQGWNHFRK
ncbi:MAG: thiamine-phosphate kinase [Bacteroidia bacterium]|nr:thiamine-phosphate kinase [Bacteroidia bacterium]